MPSQTQTPGTHKGGRAERIDPRADPAAWIANNERITNEADVEAWLALYAPDAVLETITAGAYERAEGIERIRPLVEGLVEICGRFSLRVSKKFLAADGDVIVNTWTGGFEGRDRQFGTEIWTLRDDLAVGHEMYTFLDVRPASDPRAGLRALLAGEPRLVLALDRHRRRVAREGQLTPVAS